MPDIDVNDVLVSLDIACQSFDIVRRQEIVGANGVATIVPATIPGQVGAVQPLGDNSLLREEQFTTLNNGIEVWCAVRLFGAGKFAAQGYQPDLILWDGNYYEVRVVDGWDQFGAGFTHAHCMGYEYLPNQ
jgi:hypothetical protein